MVDSERLVMSAQEIARVVARIAHEIIEHTPSVADVVLVGMRTRGVPLAHRLADHILKITGQTVPVGSLDIGLYRDDLYHRGVRPRLHRTELPTSIDDKHVVLVDDVLFTGRSIRAALDALMDYGRPQRIHLAVLVDRGHRELPIRADYVGKNIPTALHDDVKVRLVEADGQDEVVVVSTE